MERLLNIALSNPVPQVSTPRNDGEQHNAPRPRPPREPADKREIMRRHNKVEVDADGRLQVRVRRHNHQTLDRLEVQVDVLKENRDRWPGEISLPLNSAEFRDGAAARCRVAGASKTNVIVPEMLVPSKGHLQILIEVLEGTIETWRKFLNSKSDGND